MSQAFRQFQYPTSPETPRKEDVIRRLLAHHAEQTKRAAERVQPAPAPGYRPETLRVLFGTSTP
jgi:hypothetical protein